jgi:hypothetical protein
MATSAAEALSMLAEHGDEAKLLAGGHSLLPMMKLRLAVDVDGAGPAEAGAAPVLGAREAGEVANGPEQWHVAGSVEAGFGPVQCEFRHGEGPPGFPLEVKAPHGRFVELTCDARVAPYRVRAASATAQAGIATGASQAAKSALARSV